MLLRLVIKDVKKRDSFKYIMRYNLLQVIRMKQKQLQGFGKFQNRAPDIFPELFQKMDKLPTWPADKSPKEIINEQVKKILKKE